jgi:hypothetical protein
MYAAWKGVTGDQRMFWSTFNGSAWAPEERGVEVGSSHGPALATFHDR